MPGLIEVGIPRGAADALARNRQRSTRVLPGVYLAQTGPASERQLDLAALRYGGDRAVFTGARSLVLQGVLDVPRGRERTLLLPLDAQRASTGFVIVRNTERMPAAETRQGLPLAPTVRGALDLARSTADRRLIQTLFSELIRDRHCTVKALADELAAGPRWGSAVPREVIRGLHAGARSKVELDGLALISASALLPPPDVNAHLYDEHEQWIACVDWYWRGLVAELQSKRFHFALESWESDDARLLRLATYGLLTAPIVPSRLYTDWPALEAELAAAVTAAADSPCRVHVGPPPPWWGSRMG